MAKILEKVKDAQRKVRDAQEYNRVHNTRSHAELGELLTRIRHGAELTQQELAVGLGISRTQVTNTEAGLSITALDRFVLWCAICNKDPVDVLKEYLAADYE